MSLSRLSLAVLARKALVSAGVGSAPITSRCARRMNSLSVHGGEGLRLSWRNCASTSSSMKLRLGAWAKTASSMVFGQGDVMRAMAIWPEYHAVIAPCPKPTTSALPVFSSTMATDASVELNRAHAVTSRRVPSLKCAVTSSWCESPFFNLELPGESSTRCSFTSASVGPGAPCWIHFTSSW